MNKKLLNSSLYLYGIIGFGVMIFLVFDFKANFNKKHSYIHLGFGVLQFFVFLLTLFIIIKYLRNIKSQNEHMIKEFNYVDNFNNLIIDETPTGIIIIDDEGIIEYVNPSAGKILGSRKTIGSNILKFDTVLNCPLYDGIVNALNGMPNNIESLVYTSYTTRKQKVLNFFLTPVINEKLQSISNVIIFIHDISKEYDFKLQIENTYISTIEALAKLVDARDNYTGEHSKNVAKYAEMICDEINLSKEEKERILFAARIHDIGKIGIKDSILNKPDKLSSDEWESMKSHPVIGAEVISRIEGLGDISEIIRFHHERCDGRGYPMGLKGDEIPLGARIIAIADAFDAMTTDRVYRKGLGQERAIAILIEERGKQFNPKMVDSFLKKLDKTKIYNAG